MVNTSDAIPKSDSGKDDLEALSFDDVKAKELEEIKKRRLAKDKHLPTSTACERNLFGIALSGGGIRSATFNLGILQTLAHYRLLGKVDYLSLNSGGGYVGGWLAAWIKRDGIEHVEHRLASRVGAQSVRQQGPVKSPQDVQAGASQENTPAKSSEHSGSIAKIKNQASRTYHRIRKKIADRAGADAQDEDADWESQTIEPEPYPITHLRRYTNYLTPKVGLFSIDTWVLIATYLRNLLLNLVVIGLASTALIYAVRAVVEFGKPVGPKSSFAIFGLEITATALVLGIAGVVLFFIALTTFNHLTHPALVDPNYGNEDNSKNSKTEETEESHWLFDNPQYAVVLPTFFAAVLIAKLSSSSVESLLKSNVVGFVEWVNENLHPLVSLLPAVLEDRFPRMDNGHWALFFYFIAIWLVLSLLIYRRKPSADAEPPKQGKKESNKTGIAEILTISVVTAAVSTIITHFALWFIQYKIPDVNSPYRVVFGAPIIVIGVLLINIAFIGLSGRLLTEQQRQWWSRLGAWLMIYALAWLLLTGIVHVIPELISKTQSGGFSLTTIPVIVWLILSAAGAYSGHRLEAYQEAASIARRVFMRLAPIIFIVGLLIFNAMITMRLQKAESSEFFGFFGIGGLVANYPGVSSIMVAALYVAVTMALSSRIDVNAFSMHNFYRAQLVRAFLAASRGDREADNFIGFSRSDDMPLTDFSYHTKGERHDQYDGPIPIYNCSLNLAGTNRLALQERKADSFMFTPYHFGYHNRPSKPAYMWVKKFKKNLHVSISEPAYLCTEDYKSDISAGLAMATSGAAISPNMGFRSTASLAFLLTVFNVRLGAWVLNPRKPKPQREFTPKYGFASLFGELFARTNEDTDYVYLSDGGHFENLAVYELIRRRCRYVIATDAAADPKFAFLDLGNLIRKCRSDFGINIEIDLSEVRPDESGYSKRQFAVGRIRYDQVDKDEQPGFLVYLKSTLTGEETVDLAAYRRDHPLFPHQSTADQWFTESQFDSYRALGYQIGDAVFTNGGTDDARKMPLETFFSHLRHAAYPASKHVLDQFTNHATKLQELLADISNDPALEFLDRQLFPDSHRIGRPENQPIEWIPDDPDRFRRGFYFCNRLLQLMENVFIDLNLEREFDHPDNRGWLNLFNYWSGSDMLRLTWSLSASTYGARFQKFCDEKLDLQVGNVVGEPIDIRQLPYDEIRDIYFPPDGLTRKEQDRIEAIVEEIRKLAKKNTEVKLSTFWVFRIDAQLLGSPGEDSQLPYSLPCGCALTDDEDSLVYIRIRDHMRGLGLARQALEAMHKNGKLPIKMASCARDIYEKIARDLQRGRYFELLLYSMATTEQLNKS